MNSSQGFSNRLAMSKSNYSIKLIFKSVLNNKDLLIELIKRDISSRYRGSFMGLLWSIVNPIVMLAIYTTVFGYFLKVKWAGTENSIDFSLVLFAGLIVFNFFSECINRAPGLVLGNTNYVKKIIFPLEILSWMSIGTSLFNALISFSVWVMFYLLIHKYLSWTIIFVPLIVLPLIFVALGMSWFLSSCGVYLRDIGQITNIITTCLMYLSPVFYSVKTLPDNLKVLLLANPLTFIIEEIRKVMLYGLLPDFQGLAIYTSLSLFGAWLGFVWFQKTREGFADVL